MFIKIQEAIFVSSSIISTKFNNQLYSRPNILLEKYEKFPKKYEKFPKKYEKFPKKVLLTWL